MTTYHHPLPIYPHPHNHLFRPPYIFASNPSTVVHPTPLKKFPEKFLAFYKSPLPQIFPQKSQPHKRILFANNSQPSHLPNITLSFNHPTVSRYGNFHNPNTIFVEPITSHTTIQVFPLPQNPTSCFPPTHAPTVFLGILTQNQVIFHNAHILFLFTPTAISLQPQSFLSQPHKSFFHNKIFQIIFLTNPTPTIFFCRILKTISLPNIFQQPELSYQYSGAPLTKAKLSL